MKNKKISQLLHRLSVLFLALILAVIPMSFAVPVSASSDVLTGSSDSDYWVVDQIDDGMNRYVVFVAPFPLTLIRNQAFMFFDAVEGVFKLLVAGEIRLSLADGLLHCEYTNGVLYRALGQSQVEVDGVIYQYLASEWELVSGGGGWFGDLDALPDTYIAYRVSSASEGISVTSSLGPMNSLGILSVFSGVGSWLTGAVQSISTMFWTAESGMTVLGYLAVASLALAVILLIFYLIAGWLKFH